jgi:hypothetical protein
MNKIESHSSEILFIIQLYFHHYPFSLLCVTADIAALTAIPIYSVYGSTHLG